MKRIKKNIGYKLIITLIVFSTYSCIKDDPQQSATNPEISTKSVSSIGKTIAYSGGTISSDGGADITAKGICWSENINPTINSNKTSEGTGSEAFSSKMTGLKANTTYHVRAYVSNYLAEGYGQDITFKTHDYPTVCPCTPDTNGINFHSDAQTFTHIYAGTNANSYGEYGLTGNGPDSDLQMEFSKAPSTGRYITTEASSFLSDNQCIVYGIFGGTFSYKYIADSYDTLYVIKTGTDKYSMSFCSFHFQYDTDHEFTSDGNLTSE